MLEERMQAVAEEYDFPFSTSDDGQTYLLECTFESGRTQVVSGTSLTARGRRMHVIFTLVGAYTPDIDLADLVGRQMMWHHSKIGILGDDLVIWSSLDPLRIREDDGQSLVEDALQEVSALGDELEAELFETDGN